MAPWPPAPPGAAHRHRLCPDIQLANREGGTGGESPSEKPEARAGDPLPVKVDPRTLFP